MIDDSIRVLFVDDDAVTGQVMQRNCDSVDYSCQVFSSAEKCLEEFQNSGADVVITDLRMPGMNGFELLSKLREIDSEIPVLVMTGYSSVENAVEAMKRGATDFIKKPFDFEELRLLLGRTIQAVRLRNENRLLKKRLEKERNQFGMIGEAPVMKTLFNTIEKVAEVNCCAIITGESGTGKELVARALHDYSPRRDKPFVAIDCGALSDTLLESELFGHEKGSFTGATQRRYGLMEQASGGTLFLDEICNISDAMQMKLMRAIEDRKIMRVGGANSIPIDLRIVAATNRDLEAMVEAKQIRHDFYHRLNVVTIRVPSLHERRADIPALIDSSVKELSQRYNRVVQGFDPISMRLLCEKEWSGNVRELRNTIERCVILADGPILSWGENNENAVVDAYQRTKFSDDDFIPLIVLEQEYISHVLKCCNGRKTEAARLLGIDKTTLWRKLRRYEDTADMV